MKHTSRLMRWLAVLLLVITVVGVTTVGAAESGLVLENMTIYTSKTPTAVEQTAAKELQRYLGKITGTTPVISQNNSTYVSGIWVGKTAKTTKAGVTYPDVEGNGEGWTIQTDKNNVYLYGGGTRGTLYAVYHLLEDMLGVRWWNLWEEYVPSMTDAVIPTNYSVSGEPSFRYRDIFASTGSEKTLFFARNRMNGWMSNAPTAYGGEITYSEPYHVHTFNRLLPPSAYFADHPDWYALVNGVRVPDGQLCMTNEELIEAFKGRIKAYVDLSISKAASDPEYELPTFIDVTPNDTGGFCECSACTASTNASGESGHLLKFVNEIAEFVEETYPDYDFTVATCAYWQYYEVPKDPTIVPRENVMIRLASNDVDLIHNINHVNNTQVKARLEAWAEILQPGQLYYWDYAVHFDRFYGVVPNMFKFQTDYQLLKELGGDGVFIELEMANTADMWDMNLWLLTKIIENPYADVRALARDFCNGYYGAAAGADVYSYLTYMEEAAANYHKSITFGMTAIDAPWLDGVEVKKANQYFERAVANTKADTSISEADRELYLNRLNAARSGLDRLILANYEKYIVEASQANELFDINKQEVGRRVVQSLIWRNEMTIADEDIVAEVNEPTARVNVDSGANYLLGRYARYKGELEPDGTMWWPELPAELQALDLDPRHIYDYPTSAFAIHDANYVSKVAGAASYGGSALKWDQKAIAAYAGSLSDSYVISTSQPLSTNMDFRLLLNNPIVADGQYHLYHIEDTYIYTSGRPELYLFGGTARLSVEGLDHLKDKKVDLYLSMKIEGDPSAGNAVIYVDRLLVAEDCEDHEIVTDPSSEVGATCNSNAYGVGPCPVCGKQVKAEVEGTKAPHAITGSYTYDATTKTYSAPCSICGAATYEVEYQLPSDLLTYLSKKGIGLEHVHEFTIDDFEIYSGAELISDSDTPVGKSAKREGTTDLSLYTYAPGAASQTTFGAPNKNTANNNYGNGFKVYELTGAAIPTEPINYWHTFTWAVHSTVMVNELSHLAGVNVGAYMSLKTTRSGSFLNYTYTYYMDRLYIVEPCGGCGAGRASNKYAVRFNTNGGSYVSELGVTAGGTVSAPANPTKADYIFAGWYLGDQPYDFSLPVDRPITLTAKWERQRNYVAQLGSTKYESLYDAISAAKENDTIQLLADSDESVVITKAMTILKNGHSASGIIVSNSFEVIETNDAYIINRTTSGYVVTFVNDGKTTTQFVPEGESLARPEDPVKDGYTFLGWYNGGIEYDFFDTVTEDMMLVAKWTGTIKWTAGSLVLDSLLRIKVKCVFLNFDGYDSSVENEAFMNAGGCLVWTEDTAPTDTNSAIHGTQEYDLDLSAAGVNAGAKYGGIYQYAVDIPIWSWDFSENYYFRPYFIVDGEYVYGELKEYGVQQYAASKFKGSNEYLKSLLVAMLNYGTSSQIKFNKDTDKLANFIVDEYITKYGLNVSYADITSSWSESYLTEPIPASSDMTANIQATDPENIKFVGASLRLDDAINVKYTGTIGDNRELYDNIKSSKIYFWSEPNYNEIRENGDILTKENANRVAMGSKLAYNENKMRYDSFGYSYCLYSDRYGETIYAAICFEDNNGQEYWSGVMSYSVEKYVSRMLSKATDTKDIALYKWLVIYGERAQEYLRNT